MIFNYETLREKMFFERKRNLSQTSSELLSSTEFNQLLSFEKLKLFLPQSLFNEF